MKLQDSQKHDYEPYKQGKTSVEDHLANYPSAKKEPQDDTRTILVIGQHRYYKLFSAQLIQCKVGKASQLKNPLNVVNPIDFMWKAENAEELKFYAASTKFQSFYDRSQADKEALRMLFKNPKHYPVYEHNHDISEKVNVRSLSPAGISLPNVDFKIRIERTKKQYEVFGELSINGMPCLLSEIDVRLHQFLVRGNHWYLCENDEILNTIAYFKKYDNSFRLKESAFEAFQRDVLTEMENHVYIDRTYLKPAPALESHENDITIKKLIYLTEDGNYISLLPVMQYGVQEVPLRAKTQLYGLDKRGESYFIKRDDELEDHFMAVLTRQHPHFPEQMENALHYYYLHKSHFMDENWFLNAFEEWRRNEIEVFGFGEISSNRFNPNKARVNIEVTSGLNWFNTNVDVRFGNQKGLTETSAKSGKK